ncbi:hypothetical protein DC28_10000 [Spirochaeta lutea]|uniref:Uncharacterized protein n=2 Tax=Spirochaeta lutea TaxID=1480694 RepID=A0A098QUR6_9SPIO|nr:hypothetical protein DC28_10000 [Spirochaeta lutea]
MGRRIPEFDSIITLFPGGFKPHNQYIVLAMEKTPTQPKSNSKYRLTVIGLIIFAALVFIDPFGWFTPPSVFRPGVKPENAQEYARVIRTRGENAQDFLIDALQTHDVVYLSELGGLKEEPLFLAQTLPQAVDQGGADVLGVYFLLAEDQDAIDALLSAPEFDQEKAKELLFNRLPLWGYQEYLEVLKAGWVVRQRESARAQSFRILGLNIRQNYSEISSEDDMKDPAKVRTILEPGIPDLAMADTLTGYLEDHPDSTVLAYTTREQAMPEVDLRMYTEQMEGLGYPDQYQFARILHRRGYRDVAHITFHSPWPTNNTQNRSQYPAEGTVDAALDILLSDATIPDLPVAVPVSGTAFAEVEITDTIYAYGFGEDEQGTLYFGDMADAFIILQRLNRLHGATPIPHFVTAENFDQAKETFPGPISSDIRIEDFQTFIRKYAENRSNILSDMK